MPETIRYIEYGKVFVENGATDFQILDMSDSYIRDVAGKSRCENFVDWGLNFPDPPSKTPFSSKIPNLSLALVPFRDNYLFIQIQRRDEGEYARSLGITPRISRPFNQIRFVLLSPELIDKCFKENLSLYSSLIYVNNNPNNLGQDENSLKDYIQPGKIIPIPFPALPKLQFGSNKFPDLINAIFDAVDISKRTFRVLIANSNLSWKSKLEIVQQAQIFLWPLFGTITFALDYITENNVNVRFFDDSNLRSLPKEVKSYQWGSLANFPNHYLQLEEFHRNYSKYYGDDLFIEKFRSYYFANTNILDSAAFALIFSKKIFPTGINAGDLFTRNINSLLILQDLNAYLQIASFDIKAIVDFLLDDNLLAQINRFKNRDAYLEELLVHLYKNSEKLSDNEADKLRDILLKYHGYWQKNEQALKELTKGLKSSLLISVLGYDILYEKKYSSVGLRVFKLKTDEFILSEHFDNSWWAYLFSVPKHQAASKQIENLLVRMFEKHECRIEDLDSDKQQVVYRKLISSCTDNVAPSKRLGILRKLLKSFNMTTKPELALVLVEVTKSWDFFKEILVLAVELARFDLISFLVKSQVTSTEKWIYTFEFIINNLEIDVLKNNQGGMENLLKKGRDIKENILLEDSWNIVVNNLQKIILSVSVLAFEEILLDDLLSLKGEKLSAIIKVLGDPKLSDKLSDSRKYSQLFQNGNINWEGLYNACFVKNDFNKELFVLLITYHLAKQDDQAKGFFVSRMLYSLLAIRAGELPSLFWDERFQQAIENHLLGEDAYEFLQKLHVQGLRYDYIEDEKDVIFSVFSKLKQLNSELGWQLLVVEVPLLSKIFWIAVSNWEAYRRNVVAWQPKNDQFAAYSDLIQSIGDLPIDYRNNKNYSDRIEVSRRLIEYQIAGKKEHKKRLVDYVTSSDFDEVLIEKINSILNPKQTILNVKSDISELTKKQVVQRASPLDSFDKTIRQKNSDEFTQKQYYPRNNNFPFERTEVSTTELKDNKKLQDETLKGIHDQNMLSFSKINIERQKTKASRFAIVLWIVLGIVIVILCISLCFVDPFSLMRMFRIPW